MSALDVFTPKLTGETFQEVDAVRQQWLKNFMELGYLQWLFDLTVIGEPSYKGGYRYFHREIEEG